MRYFIGLVGAFMLAIFVGCGGGGGGSSSGSASNNIEVTLLDGYIVDANISDGAKTPVKFQKDKNNYRFYDNPKEFIKASGGKFTSGLENKMSFSVTPNTRVITPVVNFMQKYPDLKLPLASALNISSAYFDRDYIKDDKIEVAKLAQIIYAMSIFNLTEDFAKEVKSAKTYEAIAYSAIKVSSGNTQEKAIRNFIYSLDDKKDVKTLEEDIFYNKKEMQKTVVVTNPDDTSSSGSSVNVISVKDVRTVGNLKLDVDFSEKVIVNTTKQKSAFGIRKITHSKVLFDENQTLSLGANSIKIPLKSALVTEEATNVYKVKIDKKFLSNDGLAISQDEIQVSPSAKNLVLVSISFVNNTTIKATFNLAVDKATINQGEFSIASSKVTYEPTDVSLDTKDDKTLVIKLGNPLTINLGYDLIIKSSTLSDTSTSAKLANGVAKKEFTAKKIAQTDLSESFNLVSASVNEDQKTLILNFSKPTMANPEKSMFDVSLYAYSEPMELNITDNNGTSKTVNITPPEPFMSPDENGTSYELSIAKQSFFSASDGGRTLGSTYKKIFTITKYPKATASLSGNSISIQFNMPMDLNASGVVVTENGKDANITFGGSGANYAITNSKEFNISSTTLTIKSGILSVDKNFVLTSDFIKDFNSSK